MSTSCRLWSAPISRSSSTNGSCATLVEARDRKLAQSHESVSSVVAVVASLETTTSRNGARSVKVQVASQKKLALIAKVLVSKDRSSVKKSSFLEASQMVKS